MHSSLLETCLWSMVFTESGLSVMDDVSFTDRVQAISRACWVPGSGVCGWTYVVERAVRERPVMNFE